MNRRFKVVLSVLASLLNHVNAQFIPGQPLGVGGPLGQNHSMVIQAAQACIDAYDMPESDLLVARNDGMVKSAAYTKEIPEDNLCIVAYRGPDRGFAWIADIDMSLSYMSVKDRRRKRCRVVKHYKTLYKQKKYDEPIKKQVDVFLRGCWDAGRFVLLTGHDLGGAIATIGALEYAKSEQLWTFGFGIPPVFMPPQYRNPARLGKGPRKKHPCKHLDGDRYYTFITTALPDGPNTELVYDFMPFLNFAVYFKNDNEGSEAPEMTPTCIADAAANAAAFEASGEKGNLGQLYGSRYLFPAPNSAQGPSGVSFLPVMPDRFNEEGHKNPRRKVSFGNQGAYWVVHGYFNAPELLVNTGCGPNDVPEVHQIESYLARIESVGPNEAGIPQSTGGFAEFAECGMSTDCQSLECVILEGAVLATCTATGSRTNGRPPNMVAMNLRPMK